MRLRLASALLIPPPVGTEIDGIRRACGDGMFGKVDPHVTLVEPINVPGEAIGEVEAVLRDAAAGASGPLTCTFGPARSFGPASPVLYLGVEGDIDALATLRAAMRTGPLAREAAWPFVPHVTIGTDLSEERLDAGVAALADYSTTVTLTHVQLLQEHRDADEVRRWRPIADAALGGRSVSGRGGIELEVTEAAGRSCVLTARHDGSVVGELQGWLDGDVARLAWLSVIEGARGLGVGRRLVAEFERWARVRGAARLAALSASAGSEFLRSRGWLDEGEGLVRDL